MGKEAIICLYILLLLHIGFISILGSIGTMLSNRKSRSSDKVSGVANLIYNKTGVPVHTGVIIAKDIIQYLDA